LIDYDYTIKRNENDEWVTYKPEKIPKKLPNLVYIEGPNSSGKSTLLHLIALSFHGLKKDNLNPALKHKMESLMDTSYQETTFKFRAYDDDKIICIESKKDDPKKQLIKVSEIAKNGKETILSEETLRRKYNLIYDIPDNPTQRLNQLTRSIKEMQQSRGSKIGLLRAHVMQVISDIKNSRDPERISQLKDSIAKTEKEKEEMSEKIKNKEDFLSVIEKYTYCRGFSEFSAEYDRVYDEKDKLEHKTKRTERQIRRASNEYNLLKEDATSRMRELSEKYNTVTINLRRLLSGEDQHLLKLWEKIDLNEALRSREFPDFLKGAIKQIQVRLYGMLHNKKNEKALEEAKIWKEMIVTLEKYQTKDIIVPGVGKRISEFISMLRMANKDKESLLANAENMSSLADLITSIENDIFVIEREIFSKLREIGGVQEIEPLEDDDQNEKKIADLATKLTDLEEKIEYYERLCLKKDIKDPVSTLYESSLIEEVTPFKTYSETQLIEKISSLQQEITEMRGTFAGKERNLTYTRDEVERLEKKEPHKYQNKMKELVDILKTCQILEQKLLRTYDKYITDIIDKQYHPDPKDIELTKYFKMVSRYLGKRVGYIRHIEKEYQVESIDMIKEIIQTNGGKIIHLADMGTGQSQSAYLMAQLCTSDTRKMIALFDEVAMMDKISLKPIFKKLRALYEGGRLLIGVVVQMGPEIKIEEIQR
jgi:exonuclease SbcC